MIKELKKDKQGIVFITVLIIILVTMVLAISALSLNVSQVKSTENELKYIQAEVLSDGALFQILTDQFSATPSTTISFNETVGYTEFTVDVEIDDTGVPAPNAPGSFPLDIDVTF